jgi:chromosome segregation ATPase
MFERIGLSDQPLINRIGPHNRIDFPDFGPPPAGFPVNTRAPQQSQSPVQSMLAPARTAPDVNEALAVIGREISNRITPGDSEVLGLAGTWHEFRTRFTDFLTARAATHSGELQTKIMALTLAGRECLDRIKAMQFELGGAITDRNAMLEPLNDLRLALNHTIGQNPDGSDEDIDETFAMPEEREAWARSVARARAAVATQENALRPISAKISRLENQIAAESRQLKQIREQRRNLRLESQDGIKRVVGSGLGGRP